MRLRFWDPVTYLAVLRGREDGPHGALRFPELPDDAALENERCAGIPAQGPIARAPAERRGGAIGRPSAESFC